MSLKVLEVTGVMNRGGAEAMLMDVVRYAPADVRIDFVVNYDPRGPVPEGSYDAELRERGCTIRYIGSQLRLGPARYIREFRKIVEELKPDVVHTHLNAKNGIIALAAHRAGVKKIVSHCHADIRFRGTWLSRTACEVELWLQKWLIGWFSTDYWGCSTEANHRLYRGRNYRRSVVINNAISCDAYNAVSSADVAAVRARYGLPGDAVVLGNVGRIVPHKNIAFIVPMVAELVRRGINAYMVVAGRNDAPDYVANMMTEAERLGVKDRIVLLGERGDIPTVMQSFDIFVGPALREGFGLVAVEAQAAAVPCLLYTGFPQTVDMEVGLTEFRDDFDVNGWCDAIVRMLAKRGTVSQKTCIEAIRKRGFDAKENTKTICKLYSI